jgi:hypothetical protein
MTPNPTPTPAPPPAEEFPRWAFPLALLLGAAAGILCWLRVEPPRRLSVDCRAAVLERTAERVVYQVVIQTGFPQEILAVRPDPEGVRWDLDNTEARGEGREIRGRLTVLRGAPPGEERAGAWLMVNGRPFRRVDLPE